MTSSEVIGLTSAERGDAGNGLWLIGIGPGEVGLLTHGAVEAAIACDHRFLEGYTAIIPDGRLEDLEGVLGSWEQIMRGEVEKPVRLLELAACSKVALLIVGDALQATTHIDLVLRCDEANIPCTVIHGISITTLVGKAGLQSYRFGRQTTIPFSHGEYLPTSPLETILSNLETNLHTLVLFDLDPTGSGEERPQPMSPGEAIGLLLSMDEKFDERRRWEGPATNRAVGGIESWKAILCSDLGTEVERFRSGSLTSLADVEGGGMYCLIIPAALHDVEKEALTRWKGE